MTQPTKSDNIKDALNESGIPFQYAVIRAFDQIKKDNQSTYFWDHVTTEMPVECHGKTTHVDAVFAGSDVFLICESKRVNPAFSIWCFAKSTYSQPDSTLLHFDVSSRISPDGAVAEP